MKKVTLFIWLALIAGSVFAGGRYGTAITHGGKAKVSFHVLNPEHQPVAGANVEVGFYYDPQKQGIITAQTDTNGMCSIEGMTQMDMWFQVKKKGSYDTKGHYVFGMVDPPVINNRWQPWNPTNTVVLKPIKNPVPMLVKKVNATIPVLETPVGFDLEQGDWVTPYGKGSQEDMIIFAKGNFASNFERNSFLEITFGNQKDGIQTFDMPVDSEFKDQSAFVSPYIAPELNYATNWIYERKITQNREERINPSPRGDMNFIFRVRTVLNEKGEIISAQYGKIYGDIVCDFANEKNLGIYFTYYLNPEPNSRNLEFDTKQNLFPDEKINQP
jgi:hypothetical protein